MLFQHCAHSVLLLIRHARCRAATHILFCRALQPFGWRGDRYAVEGFRDSTWPSNGRKSLLRYAKLKLAKYGARQLSYIEGWYAISEANRIFGFDGWSRETVESRCVLARENRGAFL